MWNDIEVDKATLDAFEREFYRKAKFYTDENIEQVVVEIMRDLKLDVVTANEAGLVHRDDTEHMAYAYKEDRILLTYDKDFLNDREFPPNCCPGLVVLDIQPLSRDVLVDALYLLKTVIAKYRNVWRESKIMIHKNSEMTVWMKERASGKRLRSRYRLSNGKAQEWIKAEE
ncbi:MAG TPA: DUF5615 family PIN-like protein [Candidatus Acidoferrales bacterium]|nr:DUF5615 family PIN-like protein [Candidatus Acidoferrales bacterium]